MKKLSFCVAALALTTACGNAPEEAVDVERAGVDSGRIFGAFCQADYEDNWQELLESTWEICGRFVNDLDDTDAKAFYYNTTNAKANFEESGDARANGLDTVDLLFFSGHGGAFTESESRNIGASGITATHVMWNKGQRALSANMRLGDDARGLSILSTNTCETHAGGSHSVTTPGQIAGNLYVQRWINAFRGGLRVSTSTVESGANGSGTEDIGKRYSNNLQAGQTFSAAWSGALNVGSRHDPSLLMTGTNGTDCFARMDTMTWQNHTSKPRLRDNAVGNMCRRYWENI
jgi:hypothetical protein